MNKMRSLGVYAFRTPTNDHLWYGTKFRTLNNQGNVAGITSMMHPADTVATAGGCSYDVENYMKWAPRIYEQRIACRWEKDYWLDETLTFWNNSTWSKLKRHFDNLSRDYSLFRDLFIPIRWTTGQVTMTDIKAYCTYLTEEKFPAGIAIRNLALEERRNMTILYARRKWLQTFHEGQQMINYYTMARKFKEIYGF